MILNAEKSTHKCNFYYWLFANDCQRTVILHSTGEAFIMEGEVEHPVAQSGGIEPLLRVVNHTVFLVRTVIIALIHFFAPPVVNGQIVVQVRIQILDGKHIVDIVAVGSQHIRENKVVLHINGMFHCGRTAHVLQRKRHDELAPTAVGM